MVHPGYIHLGQLRAKASISLRRFHIESRGSRGFPRINIYCSTQVRVCILTAAIKNGNLFVHFTARVTLWTDAIKFPHLAF